MINPPNWRLDLSDKDHKADTVAGAHAHTHAHESAAPAVPGGKPPDGQKIRPTASGLRSAVQGEENAGKGVVIRSELDLLIGSSYGAKPSYLTAAQRKQLKVQIERFDSDELYRTYVTDARNEIKARLQGKSAPFIKKEEFINWLLDENSWRIYEQQWRREKPEDTHSQSDSIMDTIPLD